jgi:hypothetical protein
MGKPLSFGKVEFGLFAFFNVEVNPDKTQQRSIARSERFDATEEPAVSSLSVPYSKGRLARGAGSENGFPDSARLLMIVGM